MKYVLLIVLMTAILAGCAYGSAPEPDPTQLPPTDSPEPTATPSPTPEPTVDPSTLEAGQTRLDALGVAQVWVPAGCFMMGITDADAADVLESDPPEWAAERLPSEQPQHEVCITEGYWIDTYEVTNEQWQAFVEAGGYTTLDYWSESGQAWLERRNIDNLPAPCEASDAPDHPRTCITWFEAEAYAAWRGGRLPTEAEWEYAARGPEGFTYPWGNTWDETLAHVVGASNTAPVGSYPDGVSWVGAHDMAGNAMEWVFDWLDEDYYADSPTDDPTGPAEGRIKVERGGWWGSNPTVARTTYRHFEDSPGYFDKHIGVRIVTPFSGEAGAPPQ